VGDLASKTDRKGQKIGYTYDQLNRLTQKTYPDSTTVNYTYDNDSRLTQVIDATGTYQFTFDNMGRLTGTTTQYSFLGRSFSTSYNYDAASNRIGFTDPEGGSTTYAYDNLNRLQTLTPPAAFTTGLPPSASGSFGFAYDALNRRTQMTRPNTVTTNYTYDNLSRLLSVLHQVGGNTIDGASYTLDSAGNRTAKTDQRAGVTTNYGYDQIYQLLSATQNSTTTESYSYDAVGNRLSALNSSGWTYNASNELTSTSSGSYSYDANGNTLTDPQGRSYTWDYENRLAQVIVPGTGAVSFKYDPLGRRIYKSSSSGTLVYSYDGDNLVEEADGSGAILSRYSQALGIDEPLATLSSGPSAFYQADGLGSVTSLSNATGTLAQTYAYNTFGKTTDTGSLLNPFQFTGRELDAETSLYYFRARYYDPGIGRFVSEDPLHFWGGDGDFYRYALGSPLNILDELGLSVTCTFNQVTGRLRCTDDSTGAAVVNTHVYSGGDEGRCPSCVNNPASQGVKGGTIPMGWYDIGPSYTWHRKGKKDLYYTMRLTPLLGNSWNSYRRAYDDWWKVGRTDPGIPSTLLMHGGKGGNDRTASEGCIIVEAAERLKIAQSGGGVLHVVSGLDPLLPSFPLVPQLQVKPPF